MHRRSNVLRCVLVCLPAVLVAWVLIMVQLPVGADAERARLSDLAHYVAAGALAVAGVAHYLRWKADPDPATLRTALGLTTIAVLFPVRTLLLEWMLPGPEAATHIALARSATLLAVFGGFAIQLRRARRPESVWRGLGRSLVVCAAVLGVLVALVKLLSPGTAAVLAEAALAATWFAFARRRKPRIRGSALVVMGVGDTLRAVVLLAGAHWMFFLCIGFDATAGVMIASLGVGGLHEAWRAEDRRVRRLADRLVRVEADLRRSQEVAQERMHDVRSTIAGVVGASQVLTRALGTPEDPPEDPPEDLTSLQRLITAELQRLECVLYPDAPDVEFDLADVLAPVLEAHRLSGLAVVSDVPSIRMSGRPHVPATILDNLLRNAAVHAPGCEARVQARVCRDAVVVTVADDGPGIGEQERATVVNRGCRGAGTRADGSGLGLYNVVTAVEALGGELTLDDSTSGGLRVRLTLPLRASAPAPSRLAAVAG